MPILPTGFIADSDLQLALESVFKQNGGQLTTNVPAWSQIITQANSDAYALIQEKLLERGFTLTKIQSWDFGTNYQTEIGVYKALIKGAGLHGYDDKFINQYKGTTDRLEDVLIVSNGAIT